jgi:hypothetical protein
MLAVLSMADKDAKVGYLPRRRFENSFDISCDSFPSPQSYKDISEHSHNTHGLSQLCVSYNVCNSLGFTFAQFLCICVKVAATATTMLMG